MKRNPEHSKKIGLSLIKYHDRQNKSHKLCKRCGEEKELSKFRLRYNANLLGQRYLHSLCIICEKAYNAERQRKHIIAHPELKEKRQEINRRVKFAISYGITVEEYDRILQKQGGVCKICKELRLQKNRKYLHIDHCHSTNKIRGILCYRCNLMIGFAGNEQSILKSAIKYLK